MHKWEGLVIKSSYTTLRRQVEDGFMDYSEGSRSREMECFFKQLVRNTSTFLG